jgi:hypothetical protein
MIDLSIERGNYEIIDGKKAWQKDPDGTHFWIHTDNGEPLIISAYDPKSILDILSKLTKKDSETSNEFLFERARERGIDFYHQLIDENEKYEIDCHIDDDYFEEMKPGILDDHRSYRQFFHLLLNEKKENEALIYWDKLDTRPREYILMWLKEEHLQFIDLKKTSQS